MNRQVMCQEDKQELFTQDAAKDTQYALLLHLLNDLCVNV